MAGILRLAAPGVVSFMSVYQLKIVEEPGFRDGREDA